QLLDAVMHLGIGWRRVLLGEKAVSGVSLGIERPDAVEFLEDHSCQHMVYRERIIGMRLLGGFEFTNRLVVFDVVEVVEALAGSGVVVGPGGDSNAVRCRCDVRGHAS